MERALGAPQPPPEGTVLEIGAGLKTRDERLDNGQASWVDLTDSIALRRRSFTDTACRPRGLRSSAPATEGEPRDQEERQPGSRRAPLETACAALRPIEADPVAAGLRPG